MPECQRKVLGKPFSHTTIFVAPRKWWYEKMPRRLGRGEKTTVRAYIGSCTPLTVAKFLDDTHSGLIQTHHQYLRKYMSERGPFATLFQGTI